VLELLRSGIPVHGLAHITGGGVLNLLRIGSAGYEISAPLPVPPIFELIAELGSVPRAEMWEVFNMGCGFCAIVPDAQADDAVALLAKHHPGTAVIGQLTPKAGEVRLPGLGLAGDSSGLRQS
jgi:phosphoribosylformylglycinamidine cyclo-ligase